MADPGSSPRLVQPELYPRLAGLLVLMILAAATEGVGLVLLVPMLELAGTGAAPGAGVVQSLGLMPRLEVLLVLFVVLITIRAGIVQARN